ncbi:MAG: nucleoside-diphosphate kinase, partial [Paludibacteraceae bacterium]|nr:nucleoside-diphosphate kinase [Paludibacteraceae bacterium]
METTLVLLKPSCVQRQLIGEVVNRFERRGLRISGMKMMQLSDAILREHYAHLVDKPFFPGLCASMQASPIVAMAISGV